MILAIDTATEFAGLALYNADTVWAEEIWYTARNHTVEVMPRLKRMLTKASLTVAELEGLAVAIGPGSYTGVRIAVALAKGLALPHNLPVMGVPTLAVTAYPHQRQTLPVITLAQAGRKRLLAATYGWVDQRWGQITSPTLTTLPELAALITQSSLVAGELKADEAAYLINQTDKKAQIVKPIDRVRRPAILAEIGAAMLAEGLPDDLDSLIPVYVSGP